MPAFISSTPGPPQRPSASRNGMLLSVPAGHTVSEWPSTSTCPVFFCPGSGNSHTRCRPKWPPGTVCTLPRSAAASAATRSTKRFTAAAIVARRFAFHHAPDHAGNFVPMPQRVSEERIHGCYNSGIHDILDINEIRRILPHRYPLLLVDRIVEMEAERIVGIKNVTHNEPFFQGHFPDFPVMPGVLIVEAMAQVAGVLVLKNMPDRDQKLVLLVAIESARFRKPVVPGDQLRIEMTHRQAQGVGGQDGRPRHGGRSRGGRSRSDVQAGRQGDEASSPRSVTMPVHPTAIVDPPARIDAGRRDRPVLHRRPGSRNRRAHAPDGATSTWKAPPGSARTTCSIPYQHRRRGLAGPEVQGRARRNAHRQPQPHPRVRHHPPRHRGRRPGDLASATTTC